MKVGVEEAIDHLKDGSFLMVYDKAGREEETDLVTPSIDITAEKVLRMRQDAGGLICVTVPPAVWKKLNLPYLQDVLQLASKDYPILSAMKADDIPYDEKSTFSLNINHRDTFTGITDNDRALTIKRFAVLAEEIMDMGEERARKSFGDEFRTPGHVNLLNATEGLVEQRMGHTEITTALLSLGDIFPSMTICEMLSPDGESLSEDEARAYGEERKVPLIEGKEIQEVWRK